MSVAGAAFGAAQSLEEILAAQMFKAKLQQQQQMEAARLQMDQQRLTMQSQRDADDEAFRGRQEDRLGAQDRERNNAVGVRRMIGEGITRRVPLDDMQGMAFAEGIDLPQAPVKKTRTVTGIGPKGEPINRVVGEDEAVEEYREPKTGPRPERDPIADHEARLKLDQKYKTSNNAADPAAEAADTAREAKRLAQNLLNHKGLDGAFGLLKSKGITLKQDTADAEVIRDALTSLLTLENTGKLKGVLSDADMAILRQASTTIASPMSPAAARSELKRVVDVMGRAIGEGPTGKMPPMNLGTSRDDVNVEDEIAKIRAARAAARKPQR